jgi:hypothetical protein
MPVRFERDDGRRRVLIVVEGVLQLDEVLSVLTQRRLDGTLAYGTLCDLRSMTGRPTIRDWRDILTEAAAHDTGQVRRGPLAIIATDPAHYVAACAYAELRQRTRTTGVFRWPEEAERWLMARQRD